MQRYKLTIEYDGTHFHGWQRQDGLPTVQAEVEKAISALSGEEKTIHCSGRTDAGVHALGQVAHVDLARRFEPFELRNGLNHFLRDSGVVVCYVEIVSEDFHARFSSKKRRYHYRILNRPFPLALQKERAWHVVKPLDAVKMQEAANHLIGCHDFSTFRAAECQGMSPVKTLEKLDVNRDGEQINITAVSKSFLHHQVRNMVGTLKLVGEGKWQPGDVKQALEARDRRAGGPTAPAHGLYFVCVDYA
jgi:tRNA pseudouridine38-40 synthase